MASITTCGCSLSHLLKRSIDLIDPGRHHQSSTIESGGTATTTTDTTQNDAPSTANHNNNNKTVSFSSSCAPPNKLISVNDVKQAYDILLHATSISSSSSSPLALDGNIQHNNKIINEHSSWKDLSILADTYRALIVASNLLLELLPHDTSSSSSDTNNTTQDEQSTKQQQTTCPLQCNNNNDNSPLTPTIIKDILSTIRRSILLLQLLEHICAIKSISQRRYNNSSNGKDLLNYEGTGDDIHDYDRSIKDLISNYDWHDDGYLPQPFTHCDIVEDTSNTTTNTEENDKKDVQSSNILLECCYRPKYPSDPPSSKHERSAYTRDWIRGDRIVSLCIDDYQYFDDYDSSMKEEVVVVANNEVNANVANDEEVEGDNNFPNTTDNLDFNDQADNTDNNIEEEYSISLNLSKKEFEEEEGRLIDIMLADNVQQSKSTQRSKAQVKRNAKERKKRKRQNKNKRKQDARCQLEESLDVTSDSATVMTNQVKPQSHTREGFLLLICEDKPLNILQHIQNNNSLCNNDNRKTKTVRIYVKLHPSGWLTIEDCSIREKEALVEEKAGSLPSRTRYLDLFIGTQTKCQPCIPDGTSSFKFQLSNIRLLGASSNSSSQSDTTSTSLNEQINIILSVDEGTGGDFMDGFEWVNTLSGAANTKSSLLNSIQTE